MDLLSALQRLAQHRHPAGPPAALIRLRKAILAALAMPALVSHAPDTGGLKETKEEQRTSADEGYAPNIIGTEALGALRAEVQTLKSGGTGPAYGEV